MSEYKKKMDIEEAIFYCDWYKGARAFCSKKTEAAIETLLAALEIDMKRVKDWDLLKLKITEAKQTANRSPNRDYKTGYICAMSYIEGNMAEMENEDGEN